MFTFEPSSIEIGPSDQKNFKVSVIPSKIMLRQEVFLIDAVIGRSSRKLLFETMVRINIVNPVLKWSTNHVVLDVFYGQNSKLWGKFSYFYIHYTLILSFPFTLDEIFVKNCGKLPIELFTRTDGEYFLIKSSGDKIFSNEDNFIIEPKEIKPIIIHFNQNLIKEFNENVQIVGRLVSKVFDQIQVYEKSIILIFNLINHK